ncbi:hypothetical protein Nepgr_031528 [Nepenthes gracilis]|uniref:Uncharacterized protein n=1 Tax=Nepenthes gracilis TaxID=150966 RepID=A0AAD3Y6X8_NEPGR|nr:hypothetical protein Nepgr_031528 [Nepenthes gracilis]
MSVLLSPAAHPCLPAPSTTAAANASNPHNPTTSASIHPMPPLPTTIPHFTGPLKPDVIGEFDDLKSETASSYQKLSSLSSALFHRFRGGNLRQNSRYSDEEEDKEEFFSPIGSSGTMEWGSSFQKGA